MKTVIIGNSGSGKTWLAKRLAAYHGDKLIHLDELFWLPGNFETQRSKAEQVQMVDKARALPEWIAEGVFGRLAQLFLQDADLLIWLDLDWPLCAERLRARAAQTQHMGRTQTDKGLAELLAWASAYETRSNDCSRSGHAALLESFKGTRQHLHTPAQVQALIDGFSPQHSSGA